MAPVKGKQISEYEMQHIKNVTENKRMWETLRTKVLIQEKVIKKPRLETEEQQEDSIDKGKKKSARISGKAQYRCKGNGDGEKDDEDYVVEDDVEEDEEDGERRKRKRGRGPQQKIIIPKYRQYCYGAVPGVEIGRIWNTRMECSRDRIMCPNIAGIHTGPEGAYSIVLSGVYEDNKDYGDYFIYAGEGGRAKKNHKAIKDQTWTKGNLALVKNIETRKPVRVIRGYKADTDFTPAFGYRYDGLYIVEKYWESVGNCGFKVFKFAFRRCPNQAPPPWVTDKQKKTNKKPRLPKTVAEKKHSQQQTVESEEGPDLLDCEMDPAVGELRQEEQERNSDQESLKEEDDRGWSAENSQQSLSVISASGSYGAMASAHEMGNEAWTSENGAGASKTNYDLTMSDSSQYGDGGAVVPVIIEDADGGDRPFSCSRYGRRYKRKNNAVANLRYECGVEEGTHSSRDSRDLLVCDSPDTLSETDSQTSLRLRQKLPLLPPDQEAALLPSVQKKKLELAKSQEQQNQQQQQLDSKPETHYKIIKGGIRMVAIEDMRGSPLTRRRALEEELQRLTEDQVRLSNQMDKDRELELRIRRELEQFAAHRDPMKRFDTQRRPSSAAVSLIGAASSGTCEDYETEYDGDSDEEVYEGDNNYDSDEQHYETECDDVSEVEDDQKKKKKNLWKTHQEILHAKQQLLPPDNAKGHFAKWYLAHMEYEGSKNSIFNPTLEKKYNELDEESVRCFVYLQSLEEKEFKENQKCYEEILLPLRRLIEKIDLSEEKAPAQFPEENFDKMSNTNTGLSHVSVSSVSSNENSCTEPFSLHLSEEEIDSDLKKAVVHSGERVIYLSNADIEETKGDVESDFTMASDELTQPPDAKRLRTDQPLPSSPESIPSDLTHPAHDLLYTPIPIDVNFAYDAHMYKKTKTENRMYFFFVMGFFFCFMLFSVTIKLAIHQSL